MGLKAGKMIDDGKIHVYAPRGMKHYIHSSMSAARCRLPRDFFVHELCNSVEEAEDQSRITGTVIHNAKRESFGDSLVPPMYDAQGNEYWDLYKNDRFTIKAGRLRHTIPCWGYVFEESTQVGALDLEKLSKTHLANKQKGRWLQLLKEGITVEGVTREMVCGPSLKGRKITVMGDTCDASRMLHLVKDSTLLVHEVTMPEGMIDKVCLYFNVNVHLRIRTKNCHLILDYQPLMYLLQRSLFTLK